MTTYNAGDLRDRVQVWRRATPTKGTRGEATVAFTLLDTRFAKFEYLQGRELEQARKVYSETSSQVKIRKPVAYTLTVQDRIRFQAKEYGIGAIIPNGDDYRDLQILLTEVT